MTGAPGTGKTTLVKKAVFKCKNHQVDLGTWPVRKVGSATQLTWHEHVSQGIAVAGIYSFPDDERFPLQHRGTSPANGGTDRLQPQSVGLLAELVKGHLASADIFVVEGCARAKVGGPLIRQAMLAACRVLVLECVCDREEAIARLQARDHGSDGKGVKGVAPAIVHDRYAREVECARQKLVDAAGAATAPVEWVCGRSDELAARLASEVAMAVAE